MPRHESIYKSSVALGAVPCYNDSDKEVRSRTGKENAVYGYVRPLIPELKVGEYERYRAVYCGLCRSMGRVTGQASRITLSYDMTFFAAVRMILEGTVPRFVPMRCPVHPLNRRLTAEENPSLRTAAALSAVLCREKNRDDRRDESLRIRGDAGEIFVNNFHFADRAELRDPEGRLREEFEGRTTMLNEFDLVAEEIRAGRKTSALVPPEATMEVMDLLDECRHQIGLVYPFEKEA